MTPDVLMVEPDIGTFALADRRLHDRFNLLWAPTSEAATTALRRFDFDVVLVRAEDVSLIERLRLEHPSLAIIALAAWEIQGERACACGATEWVSMPINYGRLGAVIEAVTPRPSAGGGPLTRLAAAPA